MLRVVRVLLFVPGCSSWMVLCLSSLLSSLLLPLSLSPFILLLHLAAMLVAFSMSVGWWRTGEGWKMHTSISREMRPTAWCFCADPRILMAMLQPYQWGSQGKLQSNSEEIGRRTLYTNAMRYAVRLMRVASVLRCVSNCAETWCGDSGRSSNGREGVVASQGERRAGAGRYYILSIHTHPTTPNRPFFADQIQYTYIYIRNTLNPYSPLLPSIFVCRAIHEPRLHERKLAQKWSKCAKSDKSKTHDIVTTTSRNRHEK